MYEILLEELAHTLVAIWGEDTLLLHASICQLHAMYLDSDLHLLILLTLRGKESAPLQRLNTSVPNISRSIT